ncbi:tetratricopeptide repeat-containing sulfotransferase family protein [Brevundimonas sp.]|uniref:tetratricopeptide repeat-containing sulfotransferase family protein n=1 Tax=Brevundimonas sp. TaxID=1871086 RepID=UPI0025D142E4|nr:tetratricopeptide repeat-containing sulfotransferase family protein [Brevundimonas sp.]
MSGRAPTPEEQALARQASEARQAGRAEEAVSAYTRLLALRPDLPDSWYNLALMQRRTRRFEDALASYAEALKRGVSEPEEVHLNRAVILIDDLDRPDEAEAELEAALRLNPAYLPALLNLGNLHEDRGRRDAAQAAYRRALEIAPGHPLALARLANASRFSAPADPLIGRLRAGLSAVSRPEDRAELGFALGRALDAVGDHDAAFDAYGAANAASRQASGARYDRTAVEAFVTRMIAAFPEAVSEDADAGEAPVFICGLFRSGSTLLERILAGHPEMRAGGELNLLPALIGQRLQPWPEAAATASAAVFAELANLYRSEAQQLRPGEGLLTDKRPDNFLNIGLIKRMFPSARVLHTVRDARDVCLSNWMLHLDSSMPQAMDLDDMAHWHGQYRRLMGHWKQLWPDAILDVDYDALVADPEPQARRVVEALGLGWDPAMLDFVGRQGAVRTASVWQVREPLYRTSSGRWRNYAHRLGTDWLAPLSHEVGAGAGSG